MSEPAKESLYPAHAEVAGVTEADVRRIASEVVVTERDRVATSVRKVIAAAINSPHMSQEDQDELLVQVLGEIFQSPDMARDIAEVLAGGV